MLRSLALDEQQERLIRVVWPKQLQLFLDGVSLLRVLQLRARHDVIARATDCAMARAIWEGQLLTDAIRAAGHLWQSKHFSHRSLL